MRGDRVFRGGSIRTDPCHGRYPQVIDLEGETSRREAHVVGDIEQYAGGTGELSCAQGLLDIEDAGPQVIAHVARVHRAHICNLPHQRLVDRTQWRFDGGNEVHLEHETPECRIGIFRRRTQHLDLEHPGREVVAVVGELKHGVPLRGAVDVVVAHEAVVLAALRIRGREEKHPFMKFQPGGGRTGHCASDSIEDVVRVGDQLLSRDEAESSGCFAPDPLRPARIDRQVDRAHRGRKAETSVDRGLRDGQHRNRNTEGVRRTQLTLEQ